MMFFYSVCNKKINVSYCILNSKLNYFNLSTLSAFFDWVVVVIQPIFPNMYAKDLLNSSEHLNLQKSKSPSDDELYISELLILRALYQKYAIKRLDSQQV